MKEWLEKFICSWFHGGGQIKRDANDCINWQCSKCGRWADPIPKEDENYIINRDVEQRLKNGG